MVQLKLASKLLEIVNAVKKVPKSGFNDHFKYAYVTESDLLDAVKEELIKHKIYLSTTITSISRTGNLTTLLVEYTFWDIESGEKLSLVGAGEGADGQDKGVYKANTGAFKYFLTRNFLISSGNDPERDSKNESHGREAGEEAPPSGDSPYKDDAKKEQSSEPHGEPVDGAPKEIVGLVDNPPTVQTEKKGGGKMSPLYKISIKGVVITSFSETHAKIAKECFEKKKEVHASYEKKQLGRGSVLNAVAVVAAKDVEPY